MTTVPVVTGNSNPYSHIYYGGINYNKIKMRKLQCVMGYPPPYGVRRRIYYSPKYVSKYGTCSHKG
jgi:hypothetical protein